MKNVFIPIRRTRTISDSESTELPDIVNTISTSSVNVEEDNINILTALTLCTIWCLISVLNNVISKSLLNNFPFPLTLTLFQLSTTALCAYPLVKIWRIPKIDWTNISYKYIVKMILPLGVGKFMSACGTHISVSKLPVSYAHTIKASMPIFVVVMSYIFYKELHSIKVYLSLTVIFIGIAIASITEISFDTVGLLSAIIATASFAFMNILTKRCLNATSMHQFSLLLLLSRISTVIFLPIWLYHDGMEFMFTHRKLSNFHGWVTILLLVLDGFLSFAQNLVAFTLIAKITPLSYAVCNVIKRLAVIVMSILFFGNPVTVLNMFGTGTAMAGVLMYNMSKAKSLKSSAVLPIHHSINKKSFKKSSAHRSEFVSLSTLSSASSFDEKSETLSLIPNGFGNSSQHRKLESRSKDINIV